jgi:ankyrin repeat protein
MVRLLIEIGGRNLHLGKNVRGEPPIYTVVSNLYLELTELLLKNGAHLEYTNSSLLVGVGVRSFEMTKLLIKYGLYVDGVNLYGETPLHYAVKSGSIETMKLLIENGADLNSFSYSNETPLYHSIESGNYEKTDLLIKNGANMNVGGHLPLLSLAVSYGKYNIVKLLLDGGANVNRSFKGLSALCIAVKKRDSPIIDLLCKYNAEIRSHHTEAKFDEKNNLEIIYNGNWCKNIHYFFPDNVRQQIKITFILRSKNPLMALLPYDIIIVICKLVADIYCASRKRRSGINRVNTHSSKRIKLI